MIGADNTPNVSSKLDLSKLPPCLSLFEPHMKRVTYHLVQCNCSHLNFVECPPSEDRGWVISEKYTPEPLWCNALILPAHIFDLLAHQTVIGIMMIIRILSASIMTNGGHAEMYLQT